MWLDVSTISLRNGHWSAIRYQPAAEQEHLLMNAPLEDADGYLDRWIDRLQFGIAQDQCRIIITPKSPRGGVGCRMVGTMFHNLGLLLIRSEQPPTKLFIQAGDSQFQPRSLITLSYLCTAERRREIYDSYSCHHLPAKPHEDHRSYEERAVNTMHGEFSAYERLARNQLRLTRMRSAPDGLFLSRAKRELVIIEAKKRKRDFAEGTAQIVQYYAQARNHPELRNFTIRTCLVTATEECTEAYRMWEKLMTSTSEMEIVIDGSSAKELFVTSY